MLTPILGLIGKRYGLAVLEPVQQGQTWAVHGQVQRMTAPTALASAQAQARVSAGAVRSPTHPAG